jgi:3-hydroxy acid dehydrogenase / malonic semialdehyde reductase
MNFSGAMVLVTGATSGIGEACARRFAGLGARVLLVGRRPERLSQLARSIGPAAHPIELDVRDRDAVSRVLGALPKEHADIDVLVNAAGLALGLGPTHEGSVDQWEQMIDTNCKGLLYVTREVVPGMIARNRGHVVHIGSVAASYPYPGGNVYGATKAFVRQLSQNMKADLAGTNVRVTCIEPGMVETEFSLVRFDGDSAKAKKVYEGMDPMTADDIADTVEWCINRPPHVNINLVELMPTAQGFSPFTVKRNTK